ncbi:MAG TPA: FemAB family XrtA/PEP-CTERM system-associated protein [Allosphingosinicella sp.]|nr:FemAB family XrtA/PEP-CTERM system-associated protein [Allosphingosinicella sp.]
MNAPLLKPRLRVRVLDLGDEAECRRADSFVAGRSGADFFHRPQWSRAVERGCGQKGHYLVAEQGDGTLAGCLPLTEIRSLLFGHALVSAGFGTGGGIVAADEAAVAALAEAAWALAASLGCASVELRGGALPEGWERREGVHSAFSARLCADPEAMLAAMPKRQRYEVRRALGAGLEVSAGNDPRHRSAFYRVYAECVRNLGTPVFPAALFEAMADEYGEDCDILVVWKDGRPEAVNFNLYFGASGQCHWGGGTAGARANRANDLMIYAFMRHLAGRGCTRADFGRSKLGSGAYERKKMWHLDERPLVYAVRTAEGAAPRDVSPLSPRYRLKVEAWKKLPLIVANRLGPMLARGLG